MTTLARWQQAQSYEKGFWEGVSQQITRGESAGIDYYRWRAGQLQTKLRRLGYEQIAQGNGRIVEVGSGPVGLVAFLPRLRIDPGHPPTLTVGGVRRLVRRHGFASLEVNAGSYWDAWKEDLLAGQLRLVAKALLGVSEFVVTVCGRKVGDRGKESTFQ